MTHESTLFDEIHQLLAAPDSGAGAPGLARVEHTLTTGYARALALEAERSRLERHLDEIAAMDDRTSEAASLRDRLAATAGELSRLRGLLEPLRARASDLRRHGDVPTADPVLGS